MEGIEQVLTKLAQAQAALRSSSIAFDDAVGHLRGVLEAVASANHAQSMAIDAVIHATEAALRLVKTNGVS